jgi:hypothetical protein
VRLLRLAAPLDRAAEQAHERQQQRSAGQREQAEGHRRHQQRDTPDQERHDGGDAERHRGGDGTDPLGVAGRHVRQLAGQVAALRAAARVEHARGDVDPQPVRGALGRPLRGAVTEAVGSRQAREDDAQEGEPDGEVGRGAARHGAVDDDADHHRHERLAGLVAAEEDDGRGHVPPLPGDRASQQLAPRRPRPARRRPGTTPRPAQHQRNLLEVVPSRAAEVGVTASVWLG